ncbi:sulfite exporter TauE/SafE family protein [Shewanella aestuarii]|uniref:Probable membrane transporter protein n=1 Tax=Shewanella aestuarii TaxID=1028752 RepID=A0A6G9QMX1_9GAMM|nr:sulfite exporter TauE/SafE family protein [Shewanella aestuarii]QIR15189.1 sulfite exporter TauE/SafE family protein [Shewanella aestuarii]
MLALTKHFFTRFPPGIIVAISLLFILWLQWALKTDNFSQLVFSHGGFILLGVIGAIFANSSGAGGGVIFIPAFSALAFSPQEAISTSFLIQCFGMTAGSLTWIHYYRKQHHKNREWHGFVPFVLCCALFSIAGLWFSHINHFTAPVSLHLSFSLFSISLGLVIIFNSLRSINQTRQPTKKHLIIDGLALSGVSFIGGIITAWLSVGVGEIIVIYLMLRGYCTKLSIATGVVVSAITVWSATPITLSEQSLANFEVLLFAGPGALIGGLIAKRIALLFSVTKLKLFFSFWIIFTGSVMLVIN